MGYQATADSTVQKCLQVKSSGCDTFVLVPRISIQARGIRMNSTSQLLGRDCDLRCPLEEVGNK